MVLMAIVADSGELLTARQLSLLQELSSVLDGDLYESRDDGSDQLCAVTSRSTDCEAFYELWHKRALDRKRMASSVLRAPWQWMETVGTRCADVCAELDALLQQLDELGRQQQVAARKTAYLSEQLEPKLQELHGLDDAAGAIQKRLGLFDHVNGMMRALDQENTFPTPAELDATLNELDNSVAYLEIHYDFNDAPKLLQHFTHLRHRACISIRGFVQRTLEQAVAQVEDFLLQQPENSTVSIQVFYHPFQAVMSNARSLVDILRKRTGIHQEYISALDELERHYREVRLKLMNAPLQEHLQTLAAPFLPLPEDSEDAAESQPIRIPVGGDLGSAVHQASVYLFDICARERSLFLDYLGEVRCTGSQEELPLLLKALAQIFHEVLLPAVVACTSVDGLQEAAQKLQDCLEAHQESGNNERAISISIPLVSLRRVQDEVLERLVAFSRAQIDSGIVKYRPNAADLDYPACILRFGSDSGASSAVRRYQADWFPPLAKTLTILSKTYRVLEPCAFESLAQEAVDACLVSLRSVSDSLKHRQGPATRSSTLHFVDSQLFMVRSLLTLREQVAAFECSAETKRTMEARSLPSARNASIESELKQVCESFVVDLVARIALPLSIIDAGELRPIELNRLIDAIGRFSANLRSSLPTVVSLIRLYLNDEAAITGADAACTESAGAVLVCPIQNRLLAFWHRWLERDPQRHSVIKDVPYASDLRSFIESLVSPPMSASFADLAKTIASTQ